MLMTNTNSGAIEVEREESEWVLAHRALSRLSRLARVRAAADAEEGRCLLAALRSAAHLHLGFGSFGEYVARLFGYKPRSIQEKLRVAEALEQLPAMASALEQGSLNWSAARELTRVAVADTEREWLAVASGKTVQQLEVMVAGKTPGDLPSSPERPEARRHVLRFEVKAETLGLFREAMNQLRRSSGGKLDDDSALMLMARQILAGPTDEGRASYQIALSVCRQCRQGRLQASGELLPVGKEIVEMAECDGQLLGLLPVVSQAVVANECAHMGARNSNGHDGGSNGSGNNSDSDSDGNNSRRSAQVRARAKQSIAPATRRAVLHRDHHGCRVPGCRNVLFVDLHHIRPRAERGSNEAANLITMCSVHHRAAHRGELIVTGDAASLRFQHADGSEYGLMVEPGVSDARARAFAALRHLGFGEAAIRRALEQIGNTSEPTSVQSLLRAALAKLTPSIPTSRRR